MLKHVFIISFRFVHLQSLITVVLPYQISFLVGACIIYTIFSNFMFLRPAVEPVRWYITQPRSYAYEVKWRNYNFHFVHLGEIT